MEPPISPLLYSVLLFVGMLILLESGRRLGVKRRPSESEGERGSLGTIEGAVFALFGLLMAFTFSGAALRFNEKRMLVAEEANTIETAYLRIYLVPQKVQPRLQELFRQYVDSRLETYRKLPDMKAAGLEMAKSKQLQNEIWIEAVADTQLPHSHPDAGKLLLPALNSMIDITTTRAMALQTHPPRIIYALLFGLGLLCSLLAGYRMATGQRRSWLHIVGFTVITVIIVYVMLDVEYPRAGLIRLEVADQSLMDARSAMK
jgi:multidrug transporter EmrE-like cation transporter